ncbi:MAG: hypothetical protein H7249_03625 [Chitinophagaceae bacterium]|nr:hypothetical protein [Oligoflexus sp.]
MSQNKYNKIVLRIILGVGLFSSAPLVRAEEASSKPEKVPDGCDLLSRGPGVALQDTEVTLHGFLENFLGDLKKDKFENLNSYFHPRAKVKSDIGDKIKSIIDSRYNAPLQYSIFRVWRLRSAEASKDVLENCPESDGAKIISSYGYEKQYAVWIQIMGQNELGRLILSIAPDKGKDSIVGFRIQQWTQSGDDWRTWAGKGENAKARKSNKEAYLAYDIAQKLVDGKDLVIYPVQNELLKKRDAIFSQAKLVDAVNSDLGTQSTAYVGTLLAKEGSGIFLREYIAKELPSQTLDNLCTARGQALQKTGWLNVNQGVRCNFIFKNMDPTKDSGLGGFYKTSEDLKLALKK